MKYLALRNWKEFQHYKDRNPPWIKFHYSILDDYAFSKIPDAHKWHVVASFLLASRTDNKIPADPAWISARIGATTKVVIEDLLASGLFEEIQQDTGASASVEHDASKPLVSEEKRRDREEERQSNARAHKLPADWTLPDEWRQWAIDTGFSSEHVDMEGDIFRDYWHSKSKDNAKTDWFKTWCNWIRKSIRDKPSRSEKPKMRILI